MLVSLLINHRKDRKIEIYVIASTIPAEERHKIEKCLAENRSSSDFTLAWLSPDKRAVEGLPVSEHISLEAYSRLLAPYVLPPDCDRVPLPRL